MSEMDLVKLEYKEAVIVKIVLVLIIECPAMESSASFHVTAGNETPERNFMENV